VKISASTNNHLTTPQGPAPGFARAPACCTARHQPAIPTNDDATHIDSPNNTETFQAPTTQRRTTMPAQQPNGHGTNQDHPVRVRPRQFT
jgi:hypothetical protein